MSAVETRRPADPGARTARYEVLAVRYATLQSTKRELYYRYGAYDEPDEEVRMDYFFWVLRGGSETILVDTGFAPEVGERRGRTCLEAPVQALGRLGIDPASVATIVVTHLHYDHIGNLAAFPRAELIVPRKELEFWTSPLARRAQFAHSAEPAEIELVQRMAAEGRVRLTEGREEILEGVTAIVVGGHSPGQQLTVVAGSGGPVVLTSDAAHFYEELERDRPFAVLSDLGECYAALDVIRELAAQPGAVVVPGHDPEVMRRFDPPDRGTEGLAVALR
jgi:glyoxylase-like metal-dependent hydrolase (beta-lactamase superfamily II)